jgi:hypothetical protein
MQHLFLKAICIITLATSLSYAMHPNQERSAYLTATSCPKCGLQTPGPVDKIDHLIDQCPSYKFSCPIKGCTTKIETATLVIKINHLGELLYQIAEQRELHQQAIVKHVNGHFFSSVALLRMVEVKPYHQPKPTASSTAMQKLPSHQVHKKQ